MSVVEILANQYGIHSQPRARIDCPFCSHRTMSIKADDTIAKCFHHDCQRYITVHQADPFYQRSLHSALEVIYQDFHKHFLSLADQEAPNVYDYCLNKRQIHAQVLRDAPLGCVPSGYDVGPAFESVVKQLTEDLNDAMQDTRKVGRPSKVQVQKVEALQRSLQFVQAKKQDLAEKIAKRENWLTFHYADGTHRFTAIRLRNPFETEKNFAFVSYNPYRAFGLFGLQMFPRGNSKVPIEKLIVTEGEFNTLQLQSLLVKRGEKEGIEFTYLYVSSVGGVNQADYDTIRRVCVDPIFLYDNDSDKDNAGFALVTKAQEFMAVEGATTPNGCSDVDEFILKFKSSEEAWTAIQEMLEDREWFYRHFSGLASEIQEARDVKKKEHRINDRVKRVILEDLLVRGILYHDEITAYFFKKKEKKLLEVSPHDHEFVLLLAKYGINAAETISRYIIEGLRNAAFHDGPRIDAHRFSHYKPESFTLYVHNHNNQMYRLTDDKIELVDNGTDGVLFLTDPKAEPFLTDYRWFKKKFKEISNPEWQASKHSVFLKLIVEMINFSDDILSPSERSLLFMLWVYCNFFREINKTRPELAWIGEKGSGKSSTNKKLGCTFFGSKFELTPLPDKVEDFDAIITNRAFVCLDNADTKKPWLEDRLATLATSGAIPKRKLYTTNEMVEYPLDCFVSLTARTPKFKRDDVADRLLMMKAKRFKKFLPENQLIADVLRQRDQIWVELMFQLQHCIHALKEYTKRDFSTAFRMADFADFGLKIAKWGKFDAQLAGIFDKLMQEQSLYALEGTAIFDPLLAWVKEHEGMEITGAGLCRALSETAEHDGYKFAYTGKERSFVQKFRNLRSNLDEFFDITERTGRGRRKVYTFQIKQDKGI